MTPTTAPTPVRRLDAQQVADVMALTEAATTADGVRPLNEASELRLRAATADELPGVVHVLVGSPVRGYAQLSGEEGDAPEVELAVHPAYRRSGIGRALLDGASRLTGARPLQGWAHGDLPAARALAASAGYVAVRELWQMRLDMATPLPEATVPDGVRIRPFRPGQDDAAWLAVNARAFADHPEQGRWTDGDLAARMAEPWFDPDGFLMADDTATGEVLGFHWTKLEGDVGEVYVVGVDPGAQGRRLGSALTLAGLHHLRRAGARLVDLYVESDNEPALAVYRRLGFEPAAVDVMYRSGPRAPKG